MALNRTEPNFSEMNLGMILHGNGFALGCRMVNSYSLGGKKNKVDYFTHPKSTFDYGPEFEVLFFMILDVDGDERYLAVASFFGPLDPNLLEISSKTYWLRKIKMNFVVEILGETNDRAPKAMVSLSSEIKASMKPSLLSCASSTEVLAIGTRGEPYTFSAQRRIVGNLETDVDGVE
ncbi:hypothetical protein B0H13DRAFT_1936526 [Mycena leptocephala]|nr:hypothetical protein B0H13DRAFT_1936526 [Mycena leptocephala]